MRLRERVPVQWLYAALGCGVAIICAGAYLAFTGKEVQPVSLPNGDGATFEKDASIGGYGFILVGLILCIAPLWHFLARHRENKRKKLDGELDEHYK